METRTLNLLIYRLKTCKTIYNFAHSMQQSILHPGSGFWNNGLKKYSTLVYFACKETAQVPAQ